MPLILTNSSSHAVKKYLNLMIMLKFIWVMLDLKIFTNYSKTKPTWAIIHFKFIHRIIVTKRELLKFGIKNDKECLYCGQNYSIDHLTLTLNALSPGHLQVMFSSCLIEPTLVGSTQQQKKYCMGFFGALLTRK